MLSLSARSMDKLQSLLAELTSGDDQRAEGVVTALAAFGREAFVALNGLLKSPQSDIRWWAVRSLAELDQPQVAPLLIKALDDPDTSVRQCAALALRRQPDSRAIPGLIQSLASQDTLLAHLAADALVAAGDLAVPPLLEVMQNGTPVARLEAVRALALIGDTRAIPALYNATNETSQLMEYWANEGLERMGLGWVFLQP